MRERVRERESWSEPQGHGTYTSTPATHESVVHTSPPAALHSTVLVFLASRCLPPPLGKEKQTATARRLTRDLQREIHSYTLQGENQTAALSIARQRRGQAYYPTEDDDHHHEEDVRSLDLGKHLTTWRIDVCLIQKEPLGPASKLLATSITVRRSSALIAKTHKHFIREQHYSGTA